MRFSGFTDEWKSYKLGEIGLFKNGVNKSKEDFGSGYPFINLEDIFDKDYLLNKEYSLVKVSKKELKEYNLNKGDVLFVRSSVKPSGVGLTTVINENLINTVFSGFIIRFRENKQILDLNFKRYCFNITSFRNSLMSKSTTSANTNINQQSLSKLTINAPCIDEQKKIASFLEIIDKKIELLNKKSEYYIKFKKYLMQQIFTQKLRFNFDDEWKQYKLKDVLTVKSSSISINQLEENTGDYPLYGASGFLKNIDFCEMDVDYISIVKDGSGVGNLSFHEKNSSIVNTSQYLLPKKNFNINFLYYLLQTINLMKYVNGSSIPHIYFKDYCIEKINIPSLDEQEKIGKLFVDVDITMENLNKNINATQEFKKGLLQQMFVVRINWRCNFKLAKSPSFNKHLLILKNKIIFIIIK